MLRFTWATRPAGAGGRRLRAGLWAIASASAFAGATPAKLGVAYVPSPAVAAVIPGMPGIDDAAAPEAAFAAAVRASSRAFWAETASQIPSGIMSPTASPRKRASGLSPTCDSVLGPVAGKRGGAGGRYVDVWVTI